MSVKRKKRNGVLIVAVIVLLVFVAGLLFSVTNGFSSGTNGMGRSAATNGRWCVTTLSSESANSRWRRWERRP